MNLFYGIFFSALIPSFIAIFSVYNEFKEGTMKNLVTSPFSRVQIIVSKILYGSVFVIGLYVIAAILAVVSGILIGLEPSVRNVVYGFKLVIVPGLTMVVFVPLMIYITPCLQKFRSPHHYRFYGYSCRNTDRQSWEILFLSLVDTVEFLFQTAQS